MRTFSQLALLSLFFVMLGQDSHAQDQKPKVTIGWLEMVRICPENLIFRAKMDTGARNSSLNASGIEKFKKDGREWVRFTVVDRDKKSMTLEKQLIRTAKIKEDNGTLDERPAVWLGICLGDNFKEIEVNLKDRTGYNYQMLIGRSFLQGGHVVDPSLKFTTKPGCPGACTP